MLAFQTPAGATKAKRLFVYSPLARIVIFSVLCAGTLMLLSLLAAALGLSAKDAPAGPRAFSIFVRYVVPFLGVYLLIVYFIERRRPAELAWDKVLPHGLVGLAAGIVFVSCVVGVLWLAGAYVVTGSNADVNWIKPLLSVGLATALAEEIVFRGVLFRMTEEGLGTWAALAISALLFGGVHLMNKEATVWSSIATAIESGVLLGLAYHVTRSLPLVMGIHMGWNFTLGTVYGIPVSGGPATGILVADRPGPAWLTGGAYGAEASVVMVAISLIASAVMLAYARRTGSIVERGRRARPEMDIPSKGAPC